MAAVALVTHSCIFRHPHMTDDGEMGIDPTEVAVTADISLNLTIPALAQDEDTYNQPATEGTAYKRRLIVEALTEGRRPVTRTILLDIADNERELTVPLTLRLTAREYTFAVWSDYVLVNENGTVDSTYFYNPDLIPNIYMGKAYRGNNAYKDAAFACTQLSLSQYRSEWNARINLEMALQRPVGRLQLMATDTRAFLDRIKAGQISGESFAVRISYPGYLCMGYNIETQTPRHSLMYMTYEHTFSTKNMTADRPFLLTFDYLFADTDVNTSIPVQLEILDSTRTDVLASCSFTTYCRAGFCTTINYAFLNSSDDSGITFDPNYSGSGTVVIVPQK